MISSFDKKSATDIMKQAIEVLNEHFKAEGIKFEPKSGRMNDIEVMLKISVKLTSQAGKENEINALINKWNSYAQLYDLPLDAINKKFISGGKEFMIVDLEPRKHMYPIIAIEVSTCTRYKFSMESIRLIFSKMQ